MRIIIQRVKNASCTVDQKQIGTIEKGLLLLVGFTHSDTEDVLNKAVKKVINLRIFEDEQHKMNKNVVQIDGAILSISQFTLYADVSEGNRPSFTQAMEANQAKKLYLQFNAMLRNNGLTVAEGQFGEHMELHFINDGPVTISLEF
ncbi:MAG: D-aminoacyl-tRNA deacylase [Bacilli bacterium]|jgi:D-tyrosyl-tRNA(Tyr) deacylase|nr:D-aminoacyl-tRNA deacylase [Bacilli bacterium]MDY0064536.1 D-aminoacyl-tRNA deacylase [Bacilli bacterium]